MLINSTKLEKWLPPDLIQRIDNNWEIWLAKYFPEYESRLDLLTDIYEEETDVSEDEASEHLEEILAQKQYSILFCLYYQFNFTNFNQEQKSFFNAVIEGDMLTVAEMLKKDATLVHINDADARYPLHHAAYRGYFEICELLLKSGAHPNITTDNYDTALHEAVDKGHYTICELLLDRGAIVNADQGNAEGELNDGNTPLHIAARRGYLDICKLLVDKAADVNMLNDDDKTPFTLAAESGYWKVCEFLHEAMGLHEYCVLRTDYQALDNERRNIQSKLAAIQINRTKYKQTFFKRHEEKLLAFTHHQKTISRFYKFKSRINKNTRSSSLCSTQIKR